MNAIVVTVGCNILLTPLDKSGYLKRQVIFKKELCTKQHFTQVAVTWKVDAW